LILSIGKAGCRTAIRWIFLSLTALRNEARALQAARPVASEQSNDVLAGLAEIRRLLRAHGEKLQRVEGAVQDQVGRVARELAAWTQQWRDEAEPLPALLKRVTAIDRKLELVEEPRTPKTSRRQPLGA
jgi:hypothetical protein